MKLLLTLQFYDVRPTCDLPPVGVMAVAFCGELLAIAVAFKNWKHYLEAIRCAQKLSQYHFRLYYCQGKGSRAVDILSRFFPEEPGKSSSREHSSLSPVVTNGLSIPKSLSVQRTSSLRYFNSRDALRKKISQPRISTEMLDGLGGCLEGGQRNTPMRISQHRYNSRTHCQKILWRPAVAPIPTYCRKGHQLWFDPRRHRPAYTSHDSGGIAYVYQWKGQDPWLDPCHRRLT